MVGTFLILLDVEDWEFRGIDKSRLPVQIEKGNFAKEFVIGFLSK